MSEIETLTEHVTALAEAVGFSGVLRVTVGDRAVLEGAFGFADRAHGVPMTLDTQLAIASGVKGLTALTVMRLVEEGALELSTSVRSLLGGDLPLVDKAVTVEHLLAHRSGIGDYLDEDAGLDVNDYLLDVPVHELANPEDYLCLLAEHPHKFSPGEKFSYCNSGYVLLAIVAERATERPFFELVNSLVCQPAGMADTTFLRSDELPGTAALGYLHRDGLRTNLLHVPVRGCGDGGIYTTAADVDALWDALFAGRIVSESARGLMLSALSETTSGLRYGLGFWISPSGRSVMLEGCDAGVSFRSVHEPTTAVTYSVLGNTSDGAWPIVRLLDQNVLAAPPPRT